MRHYLKLGVSAILLVLLVLFGVSVCDSLEIEPGVKGFMIAFGGMFLIAHIGAELLHIDGDFYIGKIGIVKRLLLHVFIVGFPVIFGWWLSYSALSGATELDLIAFRNKQSMGSILMASGLMMLLNYFAWRLIDESKVKEK